MQSHGANIPDPYMQAWAIILRRCGPVG